MARTPQGRGCKAALRQALLPDWDAGAIPLPSHHVAGFQRACRVFLGGDARDKDGDTP